MKVKVTAQVWIEKELEVDDKFQRIIDYWSKNANDRLNSKEYHEIERLENDCANHCCDQLAEEYGDRMDYDSIAVYSSDGKITIYEE